MKRLLTTLCLLVFVATAGTVSAQLTYSQFAIASGTVTLDGANPTSIETNLKSIRSCNVTVVSPNDSATVFGPTTGGEPVVLTMEFSGPRGRLDIYAWDNADPPVASTSTLYVISYFCVGSV